MLIQHASFIKYHPQLGEKLGRGPSLFLGALQFLLNSKDHGIEREGRKWIYNTAQQWAEAIGYSSRHVERIIVKLQKQGLITVRKLNKFRANHTNYYSINEEHLNLLLQEAQKKETANNLSSTKEETLSSLSFFDKMSETVRPQGGNISKKTNKENIEYKSEKTISSKNSEQVHFIKSKKEVLKDQVTSSSVTSTIAQDMTNIWNQTFEQASVQLNRQLAPLCVAAFKNKFDADLGKWRHYCQTIASSPYLTSKDFKLSFYWALKYATIDRIQNGELGVKNLPFCSYSKADALNHIQTLNEPDHCKEIRLKLLKIYGEKAYKDWFSRIHLVLKEGRVCFTAESKFMEDYIRNKFSEFMG